MNFKNLSHFELIQSTKKLVGEERRITALVIEALTEVSSRRLYAEFGFSSLFEFCVKELGMSESSAYRRIAAVKLVKDVPETTEAIETGKLSLSSVAKVHSFFQNEKKVNSKTYKPEEKREILKAIELKSAKECEKVLTTLSPQAIPRETQKRLTFEATEIRFVASNSLLEKLKQIQELTRINPGASYAEVLEKTADLALSYLRKMQSVQKKEEVVVEPKSPTINSSRYISKSTKQSVWTRDQGKCQYQDEITGRQCEQTLGLEFDHIKPFAKNGTAVPENIRLLCKTHNKLEAERQFGRETILKAIETRASAIN